MKFYRDRTGRTRLTLLMLAFTALAGCKENAMVKNYETDNSFIRSPGQPDPTLPRGNGALLPLSKGSQWSYDVHVVSHTGQVMANETGEITSSGPTKIGSLDGYILESRINGHVIRDDVYSVRPDGVYLLATGVSNALTTMSPPIPLLKYPIIEGKEQNWTGLLHYASSSGYGNALSRVSGHAKIVTGEGTFDAYRFDLIVITTINGKNESVPMTRWLVPGVGIVNQRELSGANTEIWSLKSHKIATN